MFSPDAVLPQVFDITKRSINHTGPKLQTAVLMLDITLLDEILALYILHCCKYCVKQVKAGYFRNYRMCVKLPATLNIQLEYVFYTWGNAQSFWAPLLCHQKKILSGDAQCCNKDCCECLLVRPKDENLPQNRDPRVGKLTFENLKMSNFPWVVPLRPPILGQTIDRCISIGKISYS